MSLPIDLSDGSSESLLDRIRACQICAESLPLGPRPVLRAHQSAKLLIIGQAPGTKVHESGVPWDDASGRRLRDWLGLTPQQFYSDKVGIVPMGFCYPGRGKSGDLPPRAECAPEWHSAVLQLMPDVELTLLIGTYAQKYYLPETMPTLTETVKNYAKWWPEHMALPHPSPRNNIWLKKNPWFETDVIPLLQSKVSQLEL